MRSALFRRFISTGSVDTTERASPIDILTSFRNAINDADLAVAAAKAAFKTWGSTPYAQRRQCLLEFADAIARNKDDFAILLTREQGKPNPLAHLEIKSGVDWLRAFCALDLKDEVILDDEKKRIIQRHTPLGVSVGIIPSLACAKLGPATLAGNPIIIKPSPFTPYCGLKLGELAQQCFPPGVVQALSGDDHLGPWLTAHPGPEKISFTGSTVTGKKVIESATKTMKRLTLELGGNDPAIVCSDVDNEATARKVALYCFLNSGQICLAIKRVYVHESIHEKFRDAMVKYIQTLKVGEGNEEGVFMGPVQNRMQFERVKGFLGDVEKEKYNVAVGGKSADKPGVFINPTLIDRPADNSWIVAEEPFGPVVPLLTWNDEADVISRANDTQRGLGASIWSRDLEQAERMARQLEAGSVWANSHFELEPSIPYGGHKESGVGLELGMGGLLVFCNTQIVYLHK